ncbi:hypothetical protein CgunFtcFv8_018934 [Champsocephalus gunnari]|uniref:Uncharacterized protein n=1 Tax=Champsocephalus gunnari TaxID=52237 RepID=A0AAN8HRL8_CHAGU|nr:hypothetical protein CgunFtcFv8_018934 [Champsocephalus gunnari]
MEPSNHSAVFFTAVSESHYSYNSSNETYSKSSLRQWKARRTASRLREKNKYTTRWESLARTARSTPSVFACSRVPDGQP